MTSSRSSKGRILLIEDQPALRRTYSRSLAASGFDVVQASRGGEGLERLPGGDFDLILTAIEGPAEHGSQVLAQLRSGYPEVPIVVMLEAADNQIAIQATERGVLRSLIKPIAADALEAAASQALRIRHPGLARTRLLKIDRTGIRTSSVTATHAKNEFGTILESAMRGERVFITKHDVPKAVLLSVDDFDVLSSSVGAKLDALSGEFDALLSRMQSRDARSQMKSAFDASPKQMGRAAAEAATKRVWAPGRPADLRSGRNERTGEKQHRRCHDPRAGRGVLQSR
jgi:antitoxin Phd